jgi:uncharacterized protein
MKIHVRQIPSDGLHLEGEDTGDILQIQDPDQVHALSPLTYALDVGLSEDSLWVTGHLALDVELECVRCLEKFAYPVRIEDFAFQTDLAGPETIDLTEPVREDILLALPSYPRCDWSGEKICPVDLQAKEQAAPLEAEGGANGSPAASAWQTLDQLKTPSK